MDSMHHLHSSTLALYGCMMAVYSTITPASGGMAAAKQLLAAPGWLSALASTLLRLESEPEGVGHFNAACNTRSNAADSCHLSAGCAKFHVLCAGSTCPMA